MDFDMLEDLLQNEQTPPTDIKVVGVGGAGGNAVNRMIASGLKKVTFVAMNTDIQALQRSNAQVRLPLGKELTGGLGAGGIPEVGEKAAQESREEIKKSPPWYRHGIHYSWDGRWNRDWSCLNHCRNQ